MPKEPTRQSQERKKEDMKKPPNAFIRFANQNREAVRRNLDVNTPHTELQKILSNAWTRTSIVEQDKYREEYETEYAEFRERNPGHIFKRSPNKQKNGKPSKRRKTKKKSEAHRIDYPCNQTVFRSQPPDGEVCDERAEQHIEAGTSALEHVEIEWDEVQVDVLDDLPRPKRRRREWMIVSPSTNVFPPARVDQPERSTHTSTNACQCHHHHHWHASSLPTTVTQDAPAPSSNADDHQESPADNLPRPTTTNGNNGFWPTNTFGSRQSEALYSPVFTHMLGMDNGPSCSPIVSDFSYSTSTSTSSLPLSASSLCFGSMTGSPADFVPMTPTSGGSALPQLSPDAEYLQQREFWQPNCLEWEPRECALDLTLGGGESNASQNIPSSLQPMYVDGHSSSQNYGHVDTFCMPVSDVSMPFGAAGSMQRSYAQQVSSAASGIQASSFPGSMYNSLRASVAGDFQTHYEETAQGSDAAGSSLVPSGENWDITSSSTLAEQQPTDSSESRNASALTWGYTPVTSYRASDSPSNIVHRASSLPAEQTYASLLSESRLHSVSQGRVQGSESPSIITPFNDPISLGSEPIFSQGQQVSLSPDISTWLTPHEADLFGTGLSNLPQSVEGGALEGYTATIKALYGFAPFPS